MTWYPVVNDLIGGWSVAQSPEPMSHKPREAAVAADFIGVEAFAHIIAFALNAVAEGHTLMKGAPAGPIWSYGGPTEGVAP